jgi:hypothetical protein
MDTGRLLPLLRAGALLLLGASVAHAHGGIYRGPGDVVPPSPATGPGRPGSGPAGPGGPRPTTGRPMGPSAPVPGGTGATPPPTGGGRPGAPARGPATGGSIVLDDDLTTWEFWWEFHKDGYLRVRDAVHEAGPTTGEDRFFLGGVRFREQPTLRPTKAQTIEQALPALRRAIDATDQRDIATACMVAMAKVGEDHPEFALVDVFRSRLGRRDQEVRETAALAIGIAGRAAHGEAQLLADLVLDRPAGRVAYGGDVDDRTRAFAAYGLGLLADRVDDVATQRLACDTLTQALADDRVASRNILVAVVHALGLLRVGGDDELRVAVRRDTEAALFRFFDRDEGAGRMFVQTHCLQALARLAAQDPAIDARLKARCLVELQGKAARRLKFHDLDRSAILALGERCAPDDDGKGPDAACSALLAELRGSHADEQARHFATIALGRIGGARNRERLLAALPTARKALDRPWVALALGVLAHDARRADRAAGGDGAPDALIGSELAEQFDAAREPGLVGALGVALGLAGHRDAAPALRARLLGDLAKEAQAGHLCLGLALMEDRSSIETLRQALGESSRRPLLLQQAAMALGLLGDKTTANDLLERLQDGGQNLATFAALAVAIGRIGDCRSIAPLLGVLNDASRADLARAFAAAALGGVVDARDLPWSFRISEGINYRAAVETLTNRSSGVLDIL